MKYVLHNNADLTRWLLCDTEYLTWDATHEEADSDNHITHMTGIYARII
jgi:hypothetical protein